MSPYGRTRQQSIRYTYIVWYTWFGVLIGLKQLYLCYTVIIIINEKGIALKRDCIIKSDIDANVGVQLI